MVETTDIVYEVDLTSFEGSLDDIADGDNYVRVNKDRGRADYFGTPRFYKFQGEHELGYTITEAGGTVEVLKDKLTVSSGSGSADEADISSSEPRADMSKNPSVVVRFKLNAVTSNQYRQHYLGVYSDAGHKASVKIMQGSAPYTDCWIYGYTTDGSGTTEQRLTQAGNLYLDNDTWYTLEIYVKDDRVLFYVDRKIGGTFTTNVPTTGLAKTLFVWSFCGWGVAEAFEIEIDQYEVNQEW